MSIFEVFPQVRCKSLTSFKCGRKCHVTLEKHNVFRICDDTPIVLKQKDIDTLLKMSIHRRFLFFATRLGSMVSHELFNRTYIRCFHKTDKTYMLRYNISEAKVICCSRCYNVKRLLTFYGCLRNRGLVKDVCQLIIRIAHMIVFN